MKNYQIIILLILIIYIFSSEDNCYKVNPSKKSECHNLYTEEDRNNGYFCCYVKSKGNGITATGCISLSKKEKDNIKDTIKEMESGGGEVKSLDCEASYLSIGLFSLIFLLF